MRGASLWFSSALLLAIPASGNATTPGSDPVSNVAPGDRGALAMERMGMHDAGNIRTLFWNFGMVGDYPADPGHVDLNVFHSVEAPKGSGMNYSDGITPFVLAKIRTVDGQDAYLMETGYRERQAISPRFNRVMKFEPRPGYFQTDPSINTRRSPAMSDDPSTWPPYWPDKLGDPSDPGWAGSWNGYFGKRLAADQESFTVVDDDYYDAWRYFPDSRDTTRHGLGLRIEVRGLQWSNPLARNVIFWHYDITNEGTTPYEDNILFGMYVDASIGGYILSCDGIYESDDDLAFWELSGSHNLEYAWDRFGHGVDLSGRCARTGYFGYSFLETPGNPFDGIDNDDDGIVDERRDGGPGVLITGQATIADYFAAHYDTTKFTAHYGPLAMRPAFAAGAWWTGDEDMDWNPGLDDVGADGVPGTHDIGEGDGIPTAGEPDVDRRDADEADQLGLTGFKMNRIKAGEGNPDPTVDGVLFYNESQNWPARLYQKFTDPYAPARFDPALAANYNIGYLFASGPFRLGPGETQRFSLALAYAPDLDSLRQTVAVAQMLHREDYKRLLPCPSTPMSFDLSPSTLNLRSMGHWVTATVEPEPPASPADIDVASIRLNGSVAADSSAPTSIGDADSDGRPDLTVKFDRAAVELTVAEGETVPVTISGKIGSGCFEATDLIRVRRAHVTAPSAGSVLQGGSETEVRWDTPADMPVQSVAVLFSADDGATWNLVAHELPNAGSYLWTVPSAGTDQGRIAVVLVESTDESGFEVNGVLGVSERFAIGAPLSAGEAAVRLALRGPVPNPSRSLSVSFALPDARPAVLAVYDVNGREVSRRQVGALGAGRHVVSVGAPGALTPGIYLVHLIRGDHRLVARAVVLR